MVGTMIGEYEILTVLGKNSAGGRVTYKAQKGDQFFVVKQFQFATGDSQWEGYKALNREMEILRSLDHPKIPRYVETFEDVRGFCLVQKYVEAESLAFIKPRTSSQIIEIGVQVLEILAYLQSLYPQVFHRDIKPDNILCTKDGVVHLVDFGFSRMGGGDLGASSMMMGTSGFLPPESISSRPPTKAADLYSLGATLLCLFRGIKTYEMAGLIEELGQFSADAFEGIDPDTRRWLKKMVAPRLSDRFANAEEALAALKPEANRSISRRSLEPSDTSRKSLKLISSIEVHKIWLNFGVFYECTLLAKRLDMSTPLLHAALLNLGEPSGRNMLLSLDYKEMITLYKKELGILQFSVKEFLIKAGVVLAIASVATISSYPSFFAEFFSSPSSWVQTNFTDSRLSPKP
jgi:serine/threonine protein kinase